MSKPKVAFIYSCQSQIAEALGKHFASETFDSFSAGTETKPQINQDAVRNMKQIYGIDMENTQHSKQLSEIHPVDVVITIEKIGDWKIQLEKLTKHSNKLIN